MIYLAWAIVLSAGLAACVYLTVEGHWIIGLLCLFVVGAVEVHSGRIK